MQTFHHFVRGSLVVVLAIFLAQASINTLSAQNTGPSDDQTGPQAGSPDADVEAGSDPGDGIESKGTSAVANDAQGPSLLSLVVRGGWLMLPIVLVSLVVVTVGIERTIGLRRAKVLPHELVESLGKVADSTAAFDPRQAYKLCQLYPSSAASVIRAMLLKVGRPHSEVEHAVVQASEREANKLYANVRWLNLSATVAPLLGLLGTVWGMIQAFYQTANLTSGQNKAELLANGIYVALVTTLSGLAIAIPAAVLGHMFEGRIQALFHQVDEMLFNLLPHVERYEGKVRVSRHALDGNGSEPEEPPPVPTGLPAETAPPRQGSRTPR